MHRSLYEAFCHTASEHADRPAWLLPSAHGFESIDWKLFQQHTDRLALWLSKNGIRPADRIVNLQPNSAQWAMLDLACSALGAIHSPIDPRWNDRQIASAIESLEPHAIFSTRALDGLSGRTKLPSPMRIDQAIEQATELASPTQSLKWRDTLEPNLTANILWTSGTSADPKGVMLSHSNLLSNAMAKLDAMPQFPEDMRLNLLPFAHAYARTCELTAWILSGSAMACVSTSQALIDTAKLLCPSLINAVPSVYEFMLHRADEAPSNRSQADLKSVLGGRIRQLASGGAAISERIRERFAIDGLPIFQGYGLTEASPVVCSNRASNERSAPQPGEAIQLGSIQLRPIQLDPTQPGQPMLEGVGPPVRGVELRVDSQERLWVKGPGVMQGYWRNEIATEQRIQNGWLDTGDCIAVDTADTDGASDRWKPIRIAGRADDTQVLSTGHKFAPRLLEHPIEQIPGVIQCIVVGTGRRRPLAIVNANQTTHSDPQRLLAQIRSLLCELPEHLQVSEVLLSYEPWTQENGLRHWKGGVNRREIARRFAPE